MLLFANGNKTFLNLIEIEFKDNQVSIEKKASYYINDPNLKCIDIVKFEDWIAIIEGKKVIAGKIIGFLY